MQRRRLSDDLHVLVPSDLEDAGFLVAFTERGGGVSEDPYASLNLGFRTGDRAERVRENRGRVVAALETPPFATAAQVHGAEVVRVGVGRTGVGFDGSDPVARADALSVTRPGVPVAVMVADCLPIALASPKEGIVVAVHAGWRGMAAGIVERALGSFKRAGGVRVAVGPAIGPCHYEVGEDVALAVAAGSAAGAVTERRDGRVFLDLPGTARRVLRAAGVRRIEIAEECTACEEDRFFSHRRDEITGRQALVAMRR
jgi:polyphenol oxidase